LQDLSTIAMWVHRSLLAALVAKHCGAEVPWYPYSLQDWAAGVTEHNYICRDGTEQSPINFPTCQSPLIQPRIDVTWSNQAVELSSNGHTVQVSVKPEVAAPGKMGVMVSGLMKFYTLMQCHFHYGSEHQVGGRQFPFEAHCVHSLDGSNMEQGYGVFGTFFEVAGTVGDPFLVHIEQQLYTLTQRRLSGTPDAQAKSFNLLGDVLDASSKRRLATAKKVSPWDGPLDFKELIQDKDMDKYYSYRGSFTTPPCTEAVDFYISMEHNTMTTEQHDNFKAAIGWEDAGGNFRPPQPLNARTIYGCTVTPSPIEDLAWYPYSASKWGDSVGINSHSVCASGSQQSPIDFAKCASPSVSPAIKLGWLESMVDIVNNGHTIQVSPKDTLGNIVVGTKKWWIRQCLFHWPSEHTINGKQSAMEAHCVHVLDGVREGESYGVWGAFFEVGETSNSMLYDIERHLPKNLGSARRLKGGEVALDLFGHPMDGVTKRRLEGAATSSFHGPINLNKLAFGIDQTQYWEYSGSFTTPPCTEAVTFYIMQNHAVMKQSQLDNFKDAIGWKAQGGNFRPPQRLGARVAAGCNILEDTQYTIEEAVNNSFSGSIKQLISDSVSQEMTAVLDEEQESHWVMMIVLLFITGFILAMLCLMLLIVGKLLQTAKAIKTTGSTVEDNSQAYGHAAII